jgi:hypothetical protein
MTQSLTNFHSETAYTLNQMFLIEKKIVLENKLYIMLHVSY